jgi:hypothetical protein
MSLEHSNGEPGIYHSMTSINVRFVAISPLQLQIKYAMKTSAPIQNKPIVSSLFQVASRFEDFAPAAISESASPLNQTPFADLMLHPEKLEAALNAAKVENDAFATSHKARTKRATRSAASKNKNNNLWKCSDHSLIELKQIEFTLEAPSAKSVKLAADFTDWEKYPLDMIQSENGVWFTVVPLAPGHYSYRFIVDVQWCDDPRSNLHIQNPFGTNNAIRQVA